MNKIELITEKRDRMGDVEKMDFFRDGRSTDFDVPKTSGVLFDTIQVVHQMALDIQVLKKTVEALQIALTLKKKKR